LHAGIRLIATKEKLAILELDFAQRGALVENT